MSRFVLPAILVMAVAARASAPERGQLDASPTLFTVMAAINAAGYDADVSSPNNSPLRDAVRKELAAKHLPSVEELKKFFAAHRKPNDTAELSQYISFALAVDGSPDFTFLGRGVDMPPDIVSLDGLSPLLVRFSQEAHIDQLWKQSQPAFEQMIDEYHLPVLQAVLQVNGYLRNVTSGFRGRQFQVYVDLLGAPNQVQTRSYGDKYYVVVTPSPKPQIQEVRHAYLHYLLDPLATRNSEIIMRKSALADDVERAEALPGPFKKDFLLLTTESLIKAVEARLDKKPELVDLALREGFILTPYFAEALPVYEKQAQSMQMYFPDLVKPIDVVHEDKRVANVDFLKQAPVRRVEAVPAERKVELTGAQKTLAQAEKLYRSRDLDNARQAYLQVLKQTDVQSLHASAYYGLARIAVLQRDPELAVQLFKKTLQSSPEPQIKGWTYVYLGRLSDAEGDRAAATGNYQNALAVEGASVAARQAAEQGMKESFKK